MLWINPYLLPVAISFALFTLPPPPSPSNLVGYVGTIAGMPSLYGQNDIINGPVSEAEFKRIVDIAVDQNDGSVYVCDDLYTIRKISDGTPHSSILIFLLNLII